MLDSSERISPTLAPAHFPTPLRAPGPAATSTESPVPLLRAGPDVETRPKSPSGGIRAKGTKVACGMSSPRRTARRRYYARPIRHSVDRKVALNRNYCRSVIIRTLGRIYPRLEVTCSPVLTVSCLAVASPVRTRPAIVSRLIAWTSTSDSFVAPLGLSASNSSARRRLGLRRCF
jgi:hypothetical protein